MSIEIELLLNKTLRFLINQTRPQCDADILERSKIEQALYIKMKRLQNTLDWREDIRNIHDKT